MRARTHTENTAQKNQHAHMQGIGSGNGMGEGKGAGGAEAGRVVWTQIGKGKKEWKEGERQAQTDERKREGSR